jgi:hypothetical protein
MDLVQHKYDLQPQILRVCKQLLEEGRVLLYGHNIIQLSAVWGIGYQSKWVCETCRLDAIGARNRALITKIEVHSAQPHEKAFLPMARGHHWLLLTHDQYPEMKNVPWVQFTGRESHFRSTLEHLGLSSWWQTLEQAICGARTSADRDIIRAVENEMVNQMLLKARGTMEAAKLDFDNAYHARCRTTRDVLVSCVVLCKSAAAPTSCPGRDRRHLVQYVYIHPC